MSTQQSLGEYDDVPKTAFERRWGITREELERRARTHDVSADKPAERVCEECGNRVTELSDGREAGHHKAERPGEEDCSQFIGRCSGGAE
ncbi:MAG: hypothetical protein ACOCV2_15020 [Persicimonas sp.]